MAIFVPSMFRIMPRWLSVLRRLMSDAGAPTDL
jgi:hypothetical protein